jgi:hypothetical protein
MKLVGHPDPARLGIEITTEDDDRIQLDPEAEHLAQLPLERVRLGTAMGTQRSARLAVSSRCPGPF